MAGDNRFILLFDGVCNLCNGIVNFVMDHDPDGKFIFASLQSPEARELLARFNLPSKDFNSVVLVKNDQVFIKSNAALEVAKHLKGIWPVFTIFKILPRFVRDKVYDILAKNRYRIFGRRDQCRIPTPEEKNRFLEKAHS